MRWVVTQAIRKGTGSTGLRLGPAYLRWMRHGERLPRSAEPVDYASLLLLSRDGSEFVSTVGLLGADSLQPGDGGDNDDDRCDAANAVPPRLVDATTLTDDDYQVLDAAVVATMAGKGGDSPEFHLARALLNQIRPEYWQSLTTVAQCAMTRRAY